MDSKVIEEIKRHFDVVVESLRSDIKLIAEGHIILNRKIDELHEENEKAHQQMREEMWRAVRDLSRENEKAHQQMREENEKAHQQLYQEINSLREENEKAHQQMREENEKAHQQMREENEKAHQQLYQEINSLREENEKAHQEILSAIKFSYAELDRRLTILENKYINLENRLKKLEISG